MSNLGRDYKGTVDSLSKEMKIMWSVVFAALFASLLTISAIVIGSFSAKQASYQNLQDEVQAQNTKIDTLNRELELQRIRSEIANSTTTKP